jgi:rRNA maturation endonuclease Nob1
MADGITLDVDGDIEISMAPGHVTAFVIRCPKCMNIYTHDPFFYGKCPFCGYKEAPTE